LDGSAGRSARPGNDPFGIWSAFRAASRFVRPLGKGGFGLVAECKDKHGNAVAVKKIPNPFEDEAGSRRVLREILLLRHFQHENILCIKEILPPVDGALFSDIYIVTDCMDTDLYQILSSRQQLSDQHFQWFLYQILRGLSFLHAGNVLHRDMKPSNLLVNEDCTLKICDFGLARTLDEESGGGAAAALTQYVVTRWYRPPEVLLKCKNYTRAIDMWSVGCILAEMLGRAALFQGKNYVHQLEVIMMVTGKPSDQKIEDMCPAQPQAIQQALARLPSFPPIPFSRIFPNGNPQACDLLHRLLVFDPTGRLGAREALMHPYLEPLVSTLGAGLGDDPAVFENSFESVQDPSKIQDLIVDQVLSYHPEFKCDGNRVMRLSGPTPAKRSHDESSMTE